MRVIAYLCFFILTLTAVASGEDLTKCRRTQDLYHGGTYLTTLCTSTAEVNYADAKTTCENAGMKLFVATDEKKLEALLNDAAMEFNADRAFRVYVRQWISGSLDGEDGQNPSSLCLSVFRNTREEKFRIGEFDCSRIAWPYCEFTRNF